MNPNGDLIAPANLPPPIHPPNSWYMQYYARLSEPELQSLYKWFKAIDADGSNRITANELQALKFGNQNLDLKTAQKLIKIFDLEEKNSIDFYQYAALTKFIASIQAAFIAGDKDHNGTLDKEEIVFALNATGFQLSIQTVTLFFRKYNIYNSIPFHTFLELTADIARLKTCYEIQSSDYSVGQFSYDRLLELTAL